MGIRSTATVNVPLTTYAYGIMQDRLAAYRLANLICPIVQVAAAVGTYKVYDDRNAFLVESFKRPLGGPRKRIGADGTDATYNCTPYGASTGLDDFEVALAAASGGGGIDQAQLKIKSLLSRKATSYAYEVTQYAFANLTAVANRGVWSAADVDPIDQIDEQLDALSKDVGSTENINVILGVSEWRAIRSNEKVKKRLNLTGNITLTRQMFTDALVFPVNLEVSGVSYTATKPGQSTVTKARAMAGYCLLCHTIPNATQDDASAFKCFSTSPALVETVKEWRAEESVSTMYGIDWSQDIKQTGSLCARLLAIS